MPDESRVATVQVTLNLVKFLPDGRYRNEMIALDIPGVSINPDGTLDVVGLDEKYLSALLNYMQCAVEMVNAGAIQRAQGPGLAIDEAPPSKTVHSTRNLLIEGN